MTLFSGCAKKPVDTNHNQGKKEQTTLKDRRISVLKQFEAVVDGVECALCAQDTINIFKAIKGIELVDFIKTGTDYESGYIRFCYDVNQKNIDLQMLDKKLADEGFELTSMSGSFYVQPFCYEGKRYVGLDTKIAIPVHHSNNIESLKKMIKQQPDIFLAQGDIKRDEDGSFSFVLN